MSETAYVDLDSLFLEEDEKIIAETDSYMFQTIGYNLIQGIGECLEVPVYQSILSGKSVNVEMNYTPTENDEIEDMYKLMLEIKVRINCLFIHRKIILILKE